MVGRSSKNLLPIRISITPVSGPAGLQGGCFGIRDRDCLEWDRPPDLSPGQMRTGPAQPCWVQRCNIRLQCSRVPSVSPSIRRKRLDEALSRNREAVFRAESASVLSTKEVDDMLRADSAVHQELSRDAIFLLAARNDPQRVVGQWSLGRERHRARDVAPVGPPNSRRRPENFALTEPWMALSLHQIETAAGQS